MDRHLLPRSEVVGFEAIQVNARVVRALGLRSVKQTFRRPQLMAPILVFPTLLLAIQTGGAGGAVNLPGFPPVHSFLQFMLAGAMMQSLMLAGNSGGIALAATWDPDVALQIGAGIGRDARAMGARRARGAARA